LTNGAHKHTLLELASDSLWSDEILVGLDRHNREVDPVFGADGIDLLVNLVVLSAFERNRLGQEYLLALVVKLVVGDLKQFVTDVLDFMEGVVWVLSFVHHDGRAIDFWSVCAIENIKFISELSIRFRFGLKLVDR
jgi:hypothetical protein